MKVITRRDAVTLLGSKVPKGEKRAKRKSDNDLIRTALKGGELKAKDNDTLYRDEFLWWASEKTLSKRSDKLRWPWIKKEIPIPFKPIHGSGSLLKIEQMVLPDAPKELRELLAAIWPENTNLKKENDSLKKENETLRVKRARRVSNGKEAGSKPRDK